MSFGSIFQEITAAVYWTEYRKQIMDWFGITVLAGLVFYGHNCHWLDRRDLTLLDLFTLKMEENCDTYIILILCPSQ